jgi:hypothetical protein
VPVFPPAVQVINDTTMHALANAFRAGMHAGSDYLNTTVAHLHPDIIASLQKYGLDGTNRFGFGSDAQKAANSVCDPLKKAADKLMEASKLVGFAYLAFNKNVWIPLEAAKNAQKTGQGAGLTI